MVYSLLAQTASKVTSPNLPTVEKFKKVWINSSAVHAYVSSSICPTLSTTLQPLKV